MTRDGAVALGDRAWRIAIASADDGAARAAALRASGLVDDAWHTEHYLAFTPRAAVTASGPEEAAPARVAPTAHTLAIILDGPDLADVAAAAGLAVDQVERLLLDTTLTVSFVGFAPGFAYLRGLPEILHLPRRASPRPRVPAGAVALAGGFAAIYPHATPGGWHLVGRAVDPVWHDDGPRLCAGDRVRFTRSEHAPSPPTPPAITAPSTTALILEDVRGLAFVQDRGRVGHLHQGMPPAGALVPSALALANRLVGNPDGAAGLERYGALRITATVATTVATDRGDVYPLAAGSTLVLPWSTDARAGYLAVAGGLDVPPLLGGRGTHVRAALGGHLGRPLRTGDRLPLGAVPPDRLPLGALPTASPAPPVTAPSFDPHAPIALLPGPDLDRFAPDAFARLLATPWRLSRTSDRMGTRLDGPALAPSAGPSLPAPLVAGAIEVPPDGAPMVLGPEHPTTGGYPVLAVLATADLDRFHRLPLGHPVRFSRGQDPGSQPPVFASFFRGTASAIP